MPPLTGAERRVHMVYEGPGREVVLVLLPREPGSVLHLADVPFVPPFQDSSSRIPSR
jgi:hypothetical protein